MDMNPKAIAERITKLANTLEREAFEKSYFVCSNCNHTATLSTINSRRAKVASSKGISRVNPVTVNEKVGCPACDGVMSYVPTEESSKYYVEAGVDILDAMDLVNAEKKKKEDTFEPVDEQPKPEGEEGVPELDLSFGEDVLDKSPEEEKPEGSPPEDVPPEGAPSEDAPPMEDKAPPMDDKTPPPPPMDYDSPEEKPEDMPKVDEGAPEDMPKMDEGAPEEKPEGMPEMDEGGELPKAPGMGGDTPEMPTDEETPPMDDEKPRGTSLEEPPAEGEEPPPVEEEEPMPEEKPKKKKKEVTEVPKFEKMPKDASEDFQRALKKYASAF